jgi:hypothetical protein
MFEPIAVVGRSCLLPGAHSPDALWSAVEAGQDLIGEAPADRWGLPRELALTADPRKSRDRAWSCASAATWTPTPSTSPPPTASAVRARRRRRDLLRLRSPWSIGSVHAGRAGQLREAFRPRRTLPRRASAVIGNLSFPSAAMGRYAERVWLGESLARAAEVPKVDPRNRFMSGLPAHLARRGAGAGAASASRSTPPAPRRSTPSSSPVTACTTAPPTSLSPALSAASDDLFIHVGFCALDAMSRTGQSPARSTAGPTASFPPRARRSWPSSASTTRIASGRHRATG